MTVRSSVFIRSWVVALSALLLAQFAGAALAQEAPDAMVKRVSEETLQLIKTDPLIQQGNQARIREVIEQKLLPNFDFQRMTSLAVGRNWRTATPEQQKQLVDQFRTLLVRTYSGALNQYRDEKVDYKPLRMNPSDTDVVVRTAILKSGGSPIQIDYSMAKTPEGWKAYDVVVGGVSLVTTYRDEFSTIVQSQGIDGLVKSLTEKNKGSAK